MLWCGLKGEALPLSKCAPGEITRLLRSARGGEADALDRLLEVVYPTIRAIAGNLMQDERKGHTLGATALAHEAIIRLFLHGGARVHDRHELTAAAGRQMRRLLIDHARKRLALRRGCGADLLELSGQERAAEVDLETWLLLDKLLDQLRSIDPRAAEIVELRFFAGLSREEIAKRLKINVRTVQRDWESARAWLLAGLERD